MFSLFDTRSVWEDETITGKGKSTMWMDILGWESGFVFPEDQNHCLQGRRETGKDHIGLIFGHENITYLNHPPEILLVPVLDTSMISPLQLSITGIKLMT